MTISSDEIISIAKDLTFSGIKNEFFQFSCDTKGYKNNIQSDIASDPIGYIAAIQFQNSVS